MTLKKYKTKVTDTDKLIGANIRSERTMRGFSQSTLAKACDVSCQQIQKYEKGSNRIAVSMLLTIAEFLKVSPAVFYTEIISDSDDKNTAYRDSYKLSVCAKSFCKIKDTQTQELLLKLIKHLGAIA